MYTFLLIIQVLICIALVGLVLIQKGQGADIGAVFGGGASQTVFGAQGAGNFLSHVTAVLAALFFLNSLALAYLSEHEAHQAGAGIALPGTASTAAPVPSAATTSATVSPMAASAGAAKPAVATSAAASTPSSTHKP